MAIYFFKVTSKDTRGFLTGSIKKETIRTNDEFDEVCKEITEGALPTFKKDNENYTINDLLVETLNRL